jgi:hypothetical protein
MVSKEDERVAVDQEQIAVLSSEAKNAVNRESDMEYLPLENGSNNC